MENLTNKDLTPLLNLLLTSQNWLYNHLHESYHHFITDIIPQALQEPFILKEEVIQDKIYRDKLIFTGIPTLHAPHNEIIDAELYPEQARRNNLSYMGKLTCDISQVFELIDIKKNNITSKVISTEKNLLLGKVPIMVKSQFCSTQRNKNVKNTECVNDSGGYFIINGNEKVILTHERISADKVFVFVENDKKDINNKIYYAQINSKNKKTNEIQKTVIKITPTKKIYVISPKFTTQIPLFIIMRACGIQTDKDIINYITYDQQDENMINFIKYSVDDNLITQPKPYRITTQEEALDWLYTKLKYNIKIFSKEPIEQNIERRKKMMIEIGKEFLPHLTDPSLINKAYYLGYACNKLLRTYLGRIQPDDRDNYINKRMETPGILLGNLFRYLLKNAIQDVQRFFSKQIKHLKNMEERPNVLNQFKASYIEQGFKSALSTGTWPNSRETGVANILQSYTYLLRISILRRIITPNIDAAKNKVVELRMINNNQKYFICPIESQDGPSVGIIKHLALSVTITVSDKLQDNIIKKLLSKYDNIRNFSNTPIEKLKNSVKIIMNGDIIGLIDDGFKLMSYLEEKQRNNLISRTTGISYNIDNQEIVINSDYGRLYRPLLRIENNKLLLTQKMLDDIPKLKNWDEFMIKYPNIVDYVDMEKCQYSMIAENLDDLRNNHTKMISKPKHDELNRYSQVYVKYNYAEISPINLFGILGGLAPFSNCNPSQRNIFNFAQTKQCLGIASTNHRYRTDITYMANTLYNPLTTTITTNITRDDRMPAGEMCIVAIACYTGYNQEDSAIVNKDAVDNGLLTITSYKKIEEKIQRDSITSRLDKFTKPDINNVLNMTTGNYEKLNDRGFIPQEVEVDNGDVVIGKITPIAGVIKNKSWKDTSHIYKGHNKVVVDKVDYGIKNEDGYDMIKMYLRNMRPIAVGDKVCCTTADTKVLTKRGWLFFKDLTKDDLVASLVDGKNIFYEKPLNIFEYDYEGDIYYIKSQQIDLAVTPNHNMYVKQRNKENFELIRADEICGKRVKYKKNGINTNKDIDTYTIKSNSNEYKDIVVNMNDWLVFLGIFITNGFIIQSNNKKPIKFILDDKGILIQNLELICYKLGFKVNITKYDTEFTIFNKVLWEELYNFNYISEKNRKLPDYVWDLSEKQSRILLNIMMCSKGQITKNGVCCYYTTSVNERDDFQRLCLHSGYSSNIAELESSLNYWYMTINKHKNEPQVNHGHVHQQKIQEEYYEKYKGKVYCCEVSSNVIYVKRNEKPVWCGNSRSGQKSCCGVLMPKMNMPFTRQGIVPDIIINPHCIPSRMTINQLIECVVSKYASLTGQIIDGTPFFPFDLQKIYTELKNLGFDESGEEYLYNGITGHKMKAKIFIGPTYYKRMKHMTLDKIHARSLGPMQSLTKQPSEGRPNSGGLRIGAMECDSLVSHGSSLNLKEKLCDTSDISNIYVCSVCGSQANKIPEINQYHCNMCNSNVNAVKLVMPYGFKLMADELGSVGVNMRFITKEF